MSVSKDLLFTYKYTLRFLLINKIGLLYNTYNLPEINKIIFYFSFKKLEDLDDVQIFNSFYLFKFFFGRKAFFSKQKSFFYLGKWYYNFNIQLILNNNKDIYLLLYYFLNNILINIEKSYIKKGFYSKQLNIFYFILKDVNIFSEIKTNLGLFNLKIPLNFTIYILGGDTCKLNAFTGTQIFLKNLKFASIETCKF